MNNHDVTMKPEIKTLLENLEFHENSAKIGLFSRILEEKDSGGKVGVTAHIDFRRAADKGRRFYTVDGIDGIFDQEADVDIIPVLLYFKTERDKILKLTSDQPAKKEPKKELVIGKLTEVAKSYGISPELANLFFMTFDNGLYIKNPGLLYLASKKGYSRIEINDHYEENTKEWIAECKIYPNISPDAFKGLSELSTEMQDKAFKFLTDPTNGTGRASKDNVKMTTMHIFLREMAQTRACNRALRNYTGYGGASYEERDEGQISVV